MKYKKEVAFKILETMLSNLVTWYVKINSCIAPRRGILLTDDSSHYQRKTDVVVTIILMVMSSRNQENDSRS